MLTSTELNNDILWYVKWQNHPNIYWFQIYHLNIKKQTCNQGSWIFHSHKWKLVDVVIESLLVIFKSTWLVLDHCIIFCANAYSNIYSALLCHSIFTNEYSQKKIQINLGYWINFQVKQVNELQIWICSSQNIQILG